MNDRKMLPLLMLALLALLVPLAGCDDDDDPAAPAEILPYVTAVAFGPDFNTKDYAESTSEAFVTVSHPPVVPQVTLNGSSMPMDMELMVYGAGFGFYGYYENNIDGTVELNVDLGESLGAGTAEIAMPGVCAVTSDENVILNWGQGMTSTWSPAAGADGYLVMIDFDIDVNDGSGYTYYDYNDSFVTTSTSVTINGQDIFPAGVLVADVTYFDGDIDIMPFSGPLAPGSEPNVTGSCTGMFFGLGGMAEVEVDLGTAPLAPSDRDEDEPGRVQKVLEALRQL